MAEKRIRKPYIPSVSCLKRRRLYAIWQQMIRRCNDKEHKSYPIYGDRGINVCKEWSENWLSFYEWCLNNGHQYGLQLDRKNTYEGYSPENCRFVTRTVNARNTRKTIYIEYKGEIKSLCEWCDILNLKKSYINIRYHRHKPTPEVLFETPYSKSIKKQTNIKKQIL